MPLCLKLTFWKFTGRRNPRDYQQKWRNDGKSFVLCCASTLSSVQQWIILCLDTAETESSTKSTAQNNGQSNAPPSESSAAGSGRGGKQNRRRRQKADEQ